MDEVSAANINNTVNIFFIYISFIEANVTSDPLGNQTLLSKLGVVQVGSTWWLGVIFILFLDNGFDFIDYFEEWCLDHLKTVSFIFEP